MQDRRIWCLSHREWMLILVLFDLELAVSVDDSPSTPATTDMDVSGAEDSRWDVSKLKDSISRASSSSSLKGKSTRAPASTMPRKLKYYKPIDAEETEHEDMEVLNESPVGDSEAETNDDLPCRTLDNFVVFDLDNKNAVVELDELGLEDTDITISGNVEPLKSLDQDGVAGDGQDEFDEDDEDDDDFESDNRSCGQAGSGTKSVPRSSNWDSTGTGTAPCKDGFTQRIRLSAILNYETFMTPTGQTEIWVRTCFAWYKLLNPHPGYMAVYSPLYKSVYIAHQAIEHAKTNPTLSIAQFSRELRESPSDIVSSLTPITDGDFRKLRESIIEEIQICLESTDHMELLGTPLIQAICRTGGAQKSAKRAKTGASSLQRGTRTTGKTVIVGEPKHENPACITPLIASIAQGLYARHLLSVSHFETEQAGKAPKAAGVSAAQGDVWKKRYTEGTKTKQQAEDAKGIVALADLQRHVPIVHFQSDGVRCVSKSRLPVIHDDRYHFGEAMIVPMKNDESDETTQPITIRVGETVLVNAMSPLPGYEPGSLWESVEKDADSLNAVTVSATALVRVVQITSIMYFISSERWTIHGRLLLPGRDTVLQEVALANEWYLVDSCRTYCINSSICGKVDILFIQSSQNIDVNEWIAEKRLLCRFWYDASCGMFEDVNTHIQGARGRTPMWCRSCARKNQTSDVKLGRVIAGIEQVSLDTKDTDSTLSTAVKKPALSKYLPTATVKDVEYHVHDTVYIMSEHSDQPFQIGYILRFINKSTSTIKSKATVSRVQAEVQILKRVRILPPNKRPPGTNREYDDERHLYWTPLTEKFDVASFRGKCWVAHPDDIGAGLTAYKDSDCNAFYASFEATRTWPSVESDWIELQPVRNTQSPALGSMDEDDGDMRMPMPTPCSICKRERQLRMHRMAQFLASPSTSLAESTGTLATDLALSADLPSGDLDTCSALPLDPSTILPADVPSKRVSFMCGRQPLRALDLFSGCGGLTQGMDQSGAVKTMWSVEYMPSAGLTFSKNHPEAQVYNQCSNLLLDWAIKAHHGVPARPLINKFDGKELPPMPQPGDVDFIYCGPPCQGFSRCNRFIKADDIKTSLIANALSYVDFYRPSYFLLENVRGLLNYRLGGVQVGPGKVKGGIEMGMLKFILRALTTMGYQARFYVLQAGNYGLAQSRRRLFIWACKRGCKLPGVPRPITTFEKSNQTNINLPDGTTYSPFANYNGNAPHHSISVEDAIGDLPKFEFVNPALVYPDDSERNTDWPQYIAVSGQPTEVAEDRDGSRGYVGHMEMRYLSPPLSEFQRLRRRQNQVCLPDVDKSYGELAELLHNHVCRKFNPINVERICRVVLEPGKDHSSLPEKLKPWCLSAKESAASRHNGWKGLYGRVNPKGCFGTALTEMSPMGKSGTVLLYDQRRVLSVRECARAQGFPDKFKIYSVKENDTRDMHRQIGNAVPPPLAYALSLELRQALFYDFVDKVMDDKCANNTEDVDYVLGDVCVDLSAAPVPVIRAAIEITPEVPSKLLDQAESTVASTIIDSDAEILALVDEEAIQDAESITATV
ncbi:hypothetical protein J3F81_000148 [Coemansia sp. RSA 371]|nr:hypothetical protein J3F81_000148 [Coemansia sp. RSA 371]